MNRRHDSRTDEIRVGGLQRPRRLFGFAALTVALLAVAFVAGTQIRAPHDEALSHADETIAVFSPLERRVVSETFLLPAQLTQPPEVSVTVLEASIQAAPVAEPPQVVEPAPAQTATTLEPGIDRVVVSAQALTAGDAVAPGQLLGEVSGRPVFGWASGPLYRDLVAGARGNDVRGLQELLANAGLYEGDADGVLGTGTFQALRAFYMDHGYRLPYVQAGVEGFAWREFAPVPESGFAATVAPVGTVMTAEQPLVRIGVGAATLTVTASTVQVGRLGVGANVSVRVGTSQPVPSTVLAVGALQTDAASGASGYSVAIQVPEGQVVTAADVVTVEPELRTEPALAAPLVAVRQDSQGAYVLLRTDADSDEVERVSVEITAQADGWVAISEASGLRVGDNVLISAT